MPDLDEVVEIAGEGRLACNQVLYHLKERAIEHAVIPWCQEHGVAAVAYSPLGHDSFPVPRTHGGRVLEQIAAAHSATPARSHSNSCSDTPRYSQSPRPPAQNMPPKTRAPGFCG